MIHYPNAIFKDAGMTNYAAILPDVDGCFPTGDTIDETIDAAQKLLQDHIECLLDEGMSFDFKVSQIETLKADVDYAEALVWAIVSIDETQFSTKQVRFNVSWSEYLLNRVDNYVAQSHDTRSGFLAKAAQKMLS